jgi:hypothetical protein
MEATGKHVVVLKPLMGSEDFGDDPGQLRPANNYAKAITLAREQLGNKQQSYQELLNLAKQIEAKLDVERPHARGEQRVIEVDYIAPLNDTTMMAGIGPGRFSNCSTGMSSTQLKNRRANTDFYESVKFAAAPNKFREDRGVYVVTRKFEKLLTFNTVNVLSVDGKPVMGLGGLQKGVDQLGQFDEALDPLQQPQPQQPKAPYHIVMRRGTVIDAEHMALVQPNSGIYMVGIGKGTGPSATRHIHVPFEFQCFDQFWMPITHTAYGQGCKGKNDPSHSDYVVTPKFQKVITMHTRNIRSINGKMVLDNSESWDNESGAKHLDQFDEWTIGDITDTLEE